MRVTTMYFCIVSLVSLLLLAEKQPRIFKTIEDGELAAPEQQ
jgi:hypothetical protein